MLRDPYESADRFSLSRPYFRPTPPRSRSMSRRENIRKACRAKSVAPMLPPSTLWGRNGECGSFGLRRHRLVADTQNTRCDCRLAAGLIFHLDHSTTASAVIMSCYRGKPGPAVLGCTLTREQGRQLWIF